MASRGFEARFGGQALIKKTPFGRLGFHLSFIRHHTDFDITADIAVRFDDLEKLVCESDATCKASDKEQSYSLGAELGNISEGAPRRWTVSSILDVPPVASAVLATFELIGVPYLEKYSDMNAALEAFSGDDRDAWLHSPVHLARAKRAIGLAFLLRNRARFHQLVETKRALLVARQEWGLQSFLDFAAHLEGRLRELEC